MKLTIYLHIIARLKMCGTILPLSYMALPLPFLNIGKAIIISPVWQLNIYFMETSETVQKLLQNEQSYV
jgi:hypothetical protein